MEIGQSIVSKQDSVSVCEKQVSCHLCNTANFRTGKKKTVTHKNDNRPSQDMTLHLHSKMCLS